MEISQKENSKNRVQTSSGSLYSYIYFLNYFKPKQVDNAAKRQGVNGIKREYFRE